MTLKRRISSLERSGAETPTVFASVPSSWTQAQAEQGVRAHAITKGIAPPFHVWPIHKAEVGSVTIDGIQPMQELLDHVALYGRSLGQAGVSEGTSLNN